jgi:hypothetical protein
VSRQGVSANGADRPATLVTAMVYFTASEAFLDREGRPYFLWDCDLTLDEFQARLADPDPAVRDYFLAKLMRQAKPDDVFRFTTVEELVAALPRIAFRLGRTRSFWTWLLSRWQALDQHGRPA